MEGEQLALLREEVRRRGPKPPAGPAPAQPVARVAVDLPLAHLDRQFDYLVPATLHEQAVPGCRVKVRFAGRDVDGFLISRADDTDHVGRLAPLRRVVSQRAGAAPGGASAVAAGGRPLRRHAGRRAPARGPAASRRVEGEEPEPAETRLDEPLDTLAAPWSAYPGGRGLPRRRLGDGESPRAVWTALPGAGRFTAMAAAAAATAGVRTRQPAAGTRRTRRGPPRPGADGPARLGPPRRPDRRPRPGRALPRLPGGESRSGPDRRRHPSGGLRPGRLVGPGRPLGRRRRPVRRTPGAVPPRTRGAVAAGARRVGSRAAGRARAVGRGPGPGRERLGRPADRRPHALSGRRRPRCT